MVPTGCMGTVAMKLPRVSLVHGVVVAIALSLAVAVLAISISYQRPPIAAPQPASLTSWSPDRLYEVAQKDYWLLPRDDRDRLYSANNALLKTGFTAFPSDTRFFIAHEHDRIYMDECIEVAASRGMFPWVDDSAKLFRLSNTEKVDFAFAFWRMYSTNTIDFEHERDSWHAVARAMLAKEPVAEESLRFWAKKMPPYSGVFAAYIRFQNQKPLPKADD